MCQESGRVGSSCLNTRPTVQGDVIPGEGAVKGRNHYHRKKGFRQTKNASMQWSSKGRTEEHAQAQAVSALLSKHRCDLSKGGTLCCCAESTFFRLNEL